ncbi:M48 family metallopeptidase [Pseudidiomarina marina]|uniref:Peptidase n=1 Tax=Pseudidiomarina marina TaxID=502366 RepID=A0A432YE89_9GAMM|nr:M48 family metallopeptidase [Pseudidiomarina marina]RUO59259.1 peptidase [Pseudidiomarina marina]
MVNFFEHQQQAKRNTGLLVVLFLVAFTLIIGLVAVVTAAIFGGIAVQQNGEYQFSWQPIAWVVVIVGGGILIAMLVKWLSLKPGGHVVAESLGGVRIEPNSTDPLERRILNVVEEMAIAANMPVPAVYLLPNEANINAFAAGYESKDAVIGLTRGAVETFSREQLQAVVAHEFSHILNGDMRLNIRLIAALAGILLIAHVGRIFLQSARFSSSRRRGNGNALPLVGLALFIIGYIGVFFGNIIKAAVSRQREYLADAAAVQFTRNPEALSGALQQIGAREYGSKIAHTNADETAHLFFGQALSSWFTLMATHPPLDRRIKRIQPSWNGRYPKPSKAMVQSTAEQQASQPQPSALNRLAMLALPALLLERVRSPKQAPQFIRDMMVGQLLGENHPQLSELSAAQQLALVELAIPALRVAGDSDRLALLKDLEQLEQSDDLFHWCLYQLLARQLTESKRFKEKIDNAEAFAATVVALKRAEQQQSLNLKQLELALNTCKSWSPKAKQPLVQKWVETVTSDQHISETERKLVATLCACIEEPLPDEMLTNSAS